MSLSYEKKFFKNMAEILLAKEPELMRECRAVSGDEVGCVLVTFPDINSFARCIGYTVTYLSMEQLQAIIRSPTVDWSGYTRLNPSDHFVMALSTSDLDGRTLYKTIAVKDDGGPPDASEIALYPKIAFANQCVGCSKSTIRRRVTAVCSECGERLTYCNTRCREYDTPIHSALEHAHLVNHQLDTGHLSSDV